MWALRPACVGSGLELPLEQVTPLAPALLPVTPPALHSPQLPPQPSTFPGGRYNAAPLWG